MRNRHVPGPVLVLAAATLWGTTGTAQALGPDGISSAGVALVRMTGGALLVGYAYARGRSGSLRAMWGPSLFVAIAAMAVSQPLFFGGVERTGVAVGTIVTIGSGPIFAGVLAWLVRGEAVGGRWVVATAVSVVGAILLVGGGEAAGVDAGGIALTLGAGLAWAAYLTAAKTLLERHPPVFVAGVVFAAAAVILSPSLFLSDSAWMTSGTGATVAAWLLVTTPLSYVAFVHGLRWTKVAAAATLTLAEPLTAAILGMTLLGEPARWTTITGIALVATGLLVLAKETPPEPIPG